MTVGQIWRTNPTAMIKVRTAADLVSYHIKKPREMAGLSIYLAMFEFLSVLLFAALPVVPRSMVPGDAFIPDAPVPSGCSPGPGVPPGPFMLLDALPAESAPTLPELCARAKVLVKASAPASAIAENFMFVSSFVSPTIKLLDGFMFRRN